MTGPPRGASSAEGQRDPQGLVELGEAWRAEARDLIGEHGLRKADEGVAVNARLVLQALLGTDVHLRRQAVTPRVDGRADDRGEP